jgi:hypothetical protein
MRIMLFILVSSVLNPFAGLCSGIAFRPNAIPDSNYFGNAQVSYTIRGKKTTIKNILQTEGQNITALHLNVVSLFPNEGLVRVNFTNSLTHEVFDFVVADKGTTIIHHYKPSITMEVEKRAAYMSEKLVNYYADYCKIEITAADEKHVAGKFSGQFIADDGSRIKIRNGRFDIPISEK